jgi:hypothetical protein
MVENLSRMIDELNDWGRPDITWQELVEISPERLRGSSVRTALDRAFAPEDETYQVADLLNAFERASEKAELLSRINSESMDEYFAQHRTGAGYRTTEDMLLGSYPTPIAATHSEEHVRAALVANSGAGYLMTRNQIDYAAGFDVLGGAEIDLSGLGGSFPRRSRTSRFTVIRRDDGRDIVTVREAAAGSGERADYVLSCDQFELMAELMAGSTPTWVAGEDVPVGAVPVVQKSDMDGAVIDLTRCANLRLAQRMHALLVVGHDEHGVIVKDPNLGNARIRLTVVQVRQMAVDDAGRAGSIQSFGGARRPRLNELGDDAVAELSDDD